MSARSNDVPDVFIRSFERGLEAYLTADTITDVLEAVDLRALLAGENLEDPMEYERMGKVVGTLVGRLVVRGTVGRYVPGRIVEQTIGYTVGGLVGQQVARSFNPVRLDSIVSAAIRDVEQLPRFGMPAASDRRATTHRSTNDEWAVERADESATWTEIPIDGPDEAAADEEPDDSAVDEEGSEESADEEPDEEDTDSMDDENR